MRYLIRLLTFMICFCVATFATAQLGNPVFQGTIQVPRDAVVGEVPVRAGSYQLALAEINREIWFVLYKGGHEVVRDLAIDIPARDYPMEGMKAEILRGEEHFRVRIRRGDKVVLIHFLLRGKR